MIQRGSDEQLVVNTGDGGNTFVKPYDFAGTKTFGSAEAYESYARSYIFDITIPGCEQPGRVFVGQRNDPFAINVGKIFDLVNLVPVEAGAVAGLDGIEQDPENDALADKNITTLALEVHADCLRGSGNDVIGAWTTARIQPQLITLSAIGQDEEARDAGDFEQVSRLGMPLV